VTGREYLWTDEGIAAADRNKVNLAEAIEALHASPGFRYERVIGDVLLIVMGLADSGRVNRGPVRPDRGRCHLQDHRRTPGRRSRSRRVEEAGAVTEPNFDGMSKDEIIAWFRNASSLVPLMDGLAASTDPAGPPPEVPMMLVSIRLPVALVTQLDDLARQDKLRRSEIIREALVEYAHERTAAVDFDEAEHALDVLRRIVAVRGGRADAA
jgi:Arc/MetJ-type ribon-helix-helix transcriptional regulator